MLDVGAKRKRKMERKKERKKERNGLYTAATKLSSCSLNHGSPLIAVSGNVFRAGLILFPLLLFLLQKLTFEKLKN